MAAPAAGAGLDAESVDHEVPDADDADADEGLQAAWRSLDAATGMPTAESFAADLAAMDAAVAAQAEWRAARSARLEAAVRAPDARSPASPARDETDAWLAADAEALAADLATAQAARVRLEVRLARLMSCTCMRVSSSTLHWVFVPLASRHWRATWAPGAPRAALRRERLSRRTRQRVCMPRCLAMTAASL
jgi:hypothetical protein